MRNIYLIGALVVALITLTSLGVVYLRPVRITHPPPAHRPFSGPVRHLAPEEPQRVASEPVRHLAPEGVYFTLRYFSVPSVHGVRGILPGTKVVRVRDVAPSILRVRTSDIQFDAKAQDLTNDLDLANAVSQADAQRQEAVADYLDQQRAIHQGQQDEENRLYDQEQRDIEARKPASMPQWTNPLDSWPAGTNPLERGPYNRTQDVVP
jgi:hypothetical protein